MHISSFIKPISTTIEPNTAVKAKWNTGSTQQKTAKKSRQATLKRKKGCSLMQKSEAPKMQKN